MHNEEGADRKNIHVTLRKLRAKRKGILTAGFVIWGVILINFVISSISGGGSVPDISLEQFMEKAVAEESIDRTAADIRLLQTIHKTDGIDYRYSLIADCHKGSFDAKYVTNEPIEWVDETAAVEVKIRDVQIRYGGMVYASGQYFTVPLFDDYSPDKISLEEWRDNLMKQAYQSYASDNSGNSEFRNLLLCLLILIPSLLLLLYVFTWEPKKKDVVYKRPPMDVKKDEDEEAN